VLFYPRARRTLRVSLLLLYCINCIVFRYVRQIQSIQLAEQIDWFSQHVLLLLVRIDVKAFLVNLTPPSTS
jgi:hypothetical protein